MAVIWNYLWIVVIALLAVITVAAEILDWIGRCEIIQNRFPRVWSAMNNRFLRVVALLFMITFVGKDISDRAKEPPVPALVVNIAPPPAPIIQMIQPPSPPGNGSKRIVQTGNNNQANPVTVNGKQTTNGTNSPILNGSSNTINPKP
jgi:hypothetical protein